MCLNHSNIKTILDPRNPVIKTHYRLLATGYSLLTTTGVMCLVLNINSVLRAAANPFRQGYHEGIWPEVVIATLYFTKELQALLVALLVLVRCPRQFSIMKLVSAGP